MSKLRVLIVEDEPFVAMDLAAIVNEIVPAITIVKASVASTKKVLDEPIDFAFLDVDVTNGKTYEVAHVLTEKRIPFVFVSGSSREHLPPELQTVPFIAKPYGRPEIQRLLLASPLRHR